MKTICNSQYTSYSNELTCLWGDPLSGVQTQVRISLLDIANVCIVQTTFHTPESKGIAKWYQSLRAV